MAEAEIAVRTLDGSAASVCISPDCTVQDLKALLKKCFPPAQQSPAFHLFLNGAKLKLGDQIVSHQLLPGEFLVLVPFTTKSRRDTTDGNAGCSSREPERSGLGPCTPSADSAWMDIMQDISAISDLPPLHDDASPAPSSTTGKGAEFPTEESSAGHSSSRKRRKLDVSVRSLILDIICSSETAESLFSKLNCGNLRQVFSSMNCLCDASTGKCSLHLALSTDDLDEAKICLCPSWLKRLLNCFSLLNIMYGFYQMLQKRLTMVRLREILSGPASIFDISMSEVERLLLLSLKSVMLIGEDKNPAKSVDAIVIFDVPNSTEDEVCLPLSNQQRSKKQMTSVINSIEKRQFAFRACLLKDIKNAISDDHSVPEHGDLIPLTFDQLLSKRSAKLMSSKKGPAGVDFCCNHTNLLLPDEMVDHLRMGLGRHGQIVHVEHIHPRSAIYADIPSSLSEMTRTALKSMAIPMLYSHQAEAIELALSRKNIIIATSTSSGKSLCYNVPVVEEMTQNDSSCAIYLFPTKALAQDQLRSLVQMTEVLGTGFHFGVYDGDTSREERAWLRDNANLLVTNPDMLHMSILPFHQQFHRIFSNLKYVVIDEAHTYNGAFGCHTALILRRLRRICSHIYGSEPSFIFCSATTGNPREHAMQLSGLQNIELIQTDGSPCGEKLFVLWNPPAQTTRGKNSSDWAARRASPILETSHLLAEMVQHGLKCIAFCKSRKLCELVLLNTHQILQGSAPHLVNSVTSYRGGYSVQDRRRIESELFSGKLLGVAATNALELGIDVGHVDATLHLGFPGSIASLWQQAGRSGRRAKQSLAVYVAFDGPLDQYFMNYPMKLFGGRIECCQVDACNEIVLEQHLACAAFEHALSLAYDEKYFGSSSDECVSALKKKGYLSRDPKEWSSSSMLSTKSFDYVGPEKYPSQAISIRAIEVNKYRVINMANNEEIDEIEESKAFFQIYKGAVYMNQGITYLVKTLDLHEKIAYCQKADLKYYTKTRDYTDIHLIGGEYAYRPTDASKMKRLKTTAQVNGCKVTTCVFGFKRICCGSDRVIDSVNLSLPTYCYESQAAWIPIPLLVKQEVEAQELSVRAGQHAASHALLNVVPLYLLCNLSDLGTECANPHDRRAIPERILLYDQRPGGIGVSIQVQHLFNELLMAAVELVASCTCSRNTGCPNCIQTYACSEYNEVLDKDAALLILQGVIEAEKTKFATE